ncbi:MAG: prephenate dehydratase [Candidatus Gastranaerophilales bacterium]|nr:prephenate dehydratase [Candidatus Gastranaerophilales bacterium]
MKKILFFGPYGSNTQIAAEQLSDGNELEPVCSIKKIINSVDKDPSLFGVIPIENSIEGTVRESIDNLIKTTDNDIQIIKETIVPIKHCLITKAKNLDEIKKVYSHPQALAQCNGYIVKNLANAHTIAAPNTAEAVKIITQKDCSTAAIANKKAAEIYNVPIFSENISDEPDNKTRFVLIGRVQLPKTGNDRTSFAFSTINKAGALADIMSVFKKYDINLSSIESRPSKKTFGTYTFFLECEAYITDENLQFSLAEIKPMTTFIRFLGSYPQF